MFLKIAFLAGLLAVALAQASSSCYIVGERPASDCNQFIDNFCNIASKVQIRAGDSSSHCYNLPDPRKCDFMAVNTRSVNGPPSLENCKSILRNITSKCLLGGSGRPSGTGYTFIVDPNIAHCG